jgi:hypothetical protein
MRGQGEKSFLPRRIKMAKVKANPAALKAALKLGKFTSRKLAAEFGAAFTAANSAGRIAWKRVAGKGKAKGHYVATLAAA